MTARRAAQVGDVFAVHAGGVEGLFGRVVSTSAVVGPTHGCTLVYVYRPGAALDLSGLLVPPLLVSRAPFSRGYFEFLRSEPLLPGAFLEQHAFRDALGALYDEESRPLRQPVEPVGLWRLFDQVEGLDAHLRNAVSALRR